MRVFVDLWRREAEAEQRDPAQGRRMGQLLYPSVTPMTCRCSRPLCCCRKGSVIQGENSAPLLGTLDQTVIFHNTCLHALSMLYWFKDEIRLFLWYPCLLSCLLTLSRSELHHDQECCNITNTHLIISGKFSCTYTLLLFIKCTCYHCKPMLLDSADSSKKKNTKTENKTKNGLFFLNCLSIMSYCNYCQFFWP